jgi:surface polysaccharide O-acyltransferase-like enzyme
LKERILYFDWLRVYATIMVVTIHVAANYVGLNYTEGRAAWLSANFYESIARSSVPLFVMISGALLLSGKQEINYSHFLRKRVSKILIPLVAWSFIYYCYQVFVREWIESFSLTEFIKLFLNNEISVHFWFMYMILGLYLTTPIVKIFIQHARREDVEYFLLLWFYASVIVKLMQFHYELSFNVELYHVTNYVGYFVLGYYLANYPQHVWWTRIGYAFALIGISSTFFLTYYFTLSHQGEPQLFWYEYHSPNVLLATVGVFLVFKHLFSKRKIGSVLGIANNLSFGIYLLHILVMFALMDTFVMRVIDRQHPLLAIPAEVLIVILVSGAISFIISKIPVLKKLIP